MEPVLVSCDGCGARVRITRPWVVRDRACPRCQLTLGPIQVGISDPDVAGTEDGPNAAPPIPLEPPPPGRSSARLAVLSVLGLSLVTSALSYGFILGARSGMPPDASLPMVKGTCHARCSGDPAPAMEDGPVVPRRSPVAMASRLRDIPGPSRAHAYVSTSPEGLVRSGADMDSNVPPPPPSPVSGATGSPPPAPRPATTAARSRSSLLPPDAPTRAPVTPVPIPRPADSASHHTLNNIRVRTRSGRTVVARVHGTSDGKVHVMLPDGQLGIPDRLVYTEAPFRPDQPDEIARELLDGPFQGFKLLRTAHYVLVYQSTDDFARRSARVLEDLYKGLTEAFGRFQVPVRPAEFPLVAVIFHTEADFRAHKPVDPEIQAYYEIYTNRIFFYETSERDDQAPEVAALRRPQTVAHEGTHQVLGNIGVQPRLAPWPPWLIEGLAEYCATPLTNRNGTHWSGLGKVNPLHLATLRDLDDPLSGQVAGATRPPHIGRTPGMPLVEYLVRKTELTPTDYALSWALTHYLARKRVDQFVGFLRTMRALPPFGKRTPDEQLADFRAAFGDNLARLDREIAAYLAKLKVSYQLPFYAVMFEQSVGAGVVKRSAIVSQSPSMIRQWLETVTNPRGGPPLWEAVPFPSRTRAVLTAEEWVRNPGG